MAVAVENPSWVGSRQRKKHGDRFLLGRANYLDDRRVPGALDLSIVRSPHARARIRRIDLTRVRADPRCVAAFSGEEALALADPVPHWFPATLLDGQYNEVRVLAVGCTTYVGQPVVAVVARNRNDADALRELVDIDWEVLPHVLEVEEALAPGAPKVYDHWRDNVVIDLPYTGGDYAGAASAADHVLADEFRVQRFSSQPIEPRGFVAEWDARIQRLTFNCSIQNPHPLRWMLSKALRIRESQIRVVAPDIGGGFGLKMPGHPEEALVAMLSKELEAPVRWIDSRAEALLIGAREHLHRYEVAFQEDGEIIGFKDHFLTNVGSIIAVPGWGMSMVSALTFPSGYRIANTDIRVTVVTTNKGPWGPTRGYGKEGCIIVMERMMERVAETLGIDPAQVRRRNLLTPDAMPYRTNNGLNIDSGDYPEGLERALELEDYDGFEQRRADAAAEGRRLGFGIAFELTPEAASLPDVLSGGFDSATVRVDPSGNVSVLTGVTTPGGGNDLGLAMIVADQLGVAPEDVDVVQGDTDLCPYGFGNSSGRSTVAGGGATLLAAQEMRARLLTAAAIMLDAPVEEIVLAGARASAGERSASLEEIAYAAYTQAAGRFAAAGAPLEVTRSYKPENMWNAPDETGRIQPYPTYSYAVHAAEVEVDVETGKTTVLRFGVLHDCGTMINPLAVEGQMHGAVAMGIGAALSEEQRYEADGTLVNDRFKTYLMQRASDLPAIDIAHMETPSPFTLMGVKGAGEAGVGGAQSAIVNAVNDAIRPLGARVDQSPVNAPTVLRALLDARGSDAV